MNRKRLKNRIAIILVCIGLAFLIPMLLLLGLWQNGGVAKDIVSYILDIAATVTIWEALTILIVENSEHTHIVKRMIERFDSISFQFLRWLELYLPLSRGRISPVRKELESSTKCGQFCSPMAYWSSLYHFYIISWCSLQISSAKYLSLRQWKSASFRLVVA